MQRNESSPLSSSLAASQLLQRLSLRQLRAFVAVAHAGSMTQAAARMHLTPSALSMLIKSLETELELDLFARSTRKLSLTHAGQALLPVVQTLLEGLEQSIEKLRNQSHLRHSQITVATSPLMAASLLPELIASFRQQAPQAQIRLLDMGVETIANCVRGAGADVGICTLDHEVNDLKITLLMEDSLMLACHPTHPLAKSGAGVTWQQLLGQRMVLLSAGSGLRQLVDQTLAKLPKKALHAAQALKASHSIHLLPAHEVAHVATVVGLVRAGEGIAVLPAYALHRALAEQKNSLAVLPLNAPVVKRKIVALTSRERSTPTLAQQFMLHVKKQIA
jgi:LysR family transcriptional regulator, carnitine catabolism transcriptional activator